MNKVIDFIKSNIVVVKWTIWYFLCLYLILRFLFHFDPLSAHYWWKFFHATLHGFAGFVFGLLIYSAIPIYIATTAIIYRKKELVITIPYIDKVFAYASKFLPKKKTEEPTETPTTDSDKTDEPHAPEIPSDIPPEMRVPYMRMKNNLSLTGAVSSYNKHNISNIKQDEPVNNTPSIPIPTDFDISESFDMNNDSVPTFTDINFDEPNEVADTELTNNTTKYFTDKNIEFETYKRFVVTDKYVIYEHNDKDFWIMDKDNWFASGQQIESPIDELLDLAKQNNLCPVLYLDSQNIMDLEGTINDFESRGIRIIKNLSELD